MTTDLPGELVDFGDEVGRPIDQLEQDQEEAYRHHTLAAARALTSKAKRCTNVHTAPAADFVPAAVYRSTQMATCNPETQMISDQAAEEQAVDIMITFQATCLRLRGRALRRNPLNGTAERVFRLMATAILRDRQAAAALAREYLDQEPHQLFDDQRYNARITAIAAVADRAPDDSGQFPDLEQKEVAEMLGVSEGLVSECWAESRKIFADEWHVTEEAREHPERFDQETEAVDAEAWAEAAVG